MDPPRYYHHIKVFISKNNVGGPAPCGAGRCRKGMRYDICVVSLESNGIPCMGSTLVQTMQAKPEESLVRLG